MVEAAAPAAGTGMPVAEEAAAPAVETGTETGMMPLAEAEAPASF